MNVIKRIFYRKELGWLQVESDGGHITRIDFARERKDIPSKNPLLRKCVRQLNEYFDGKRTVFGFRVEQAGSRFERRVWRALTRIPYGQTVSYQDVAKKIGKPKAVRAVASAIGRNKAAVVVPCHRVIRKSGALGGFGWGLPRKKWLLRHEAR